jgi:hypothetical protein
MTITAIYEATPQQARTLTDRIKVSLSVSWELITEAYYSRAYIALGYANWDDYCTQEFGTSRLRLPREERAEVVASLRESGLSVRAIAAATGDNRETVRQLVAAGDKKLSPAPVVDEIPGDEFDAPQPSAEFEATYGVGTELDDEPALTEEECEALDRETWDATDPCDCGFGTCECAAGFCDCTDTPAPRITGTDGKSYPTPKPKAPNRKPITDSFWAATFDLGKKVNTLVNLADDDRFKKNADQIAGTSLQDLIRARDALQRVIDQLTN